MARKAWCSNGVKTAGCKSVAEPTAPLPTELFTGSFDGRIAYQQHIRDALALASSQGWKEMWWSDFDFNDWPLGERAVIDSLQSWARSGRRLVILAGSYADIRLRHPRLVQWRGMWDHIIECRLCKNQEPGEYPSALWSPAWA